LLAVGTAARFLTAGMLREIVTWAGANALHPIHSASTAI
jgi:hypothetical protein